MVLNVPPEKLQPPARPRAVILHYHLFKNAGTSVDAVLKQNLPGRWATREFERPGRQEEVAGWVKSQPACVAFSSHTASLPPPRIPGVEVIPVLFVRHPIDRIGSVYAFERKQEAQTRGARLARAHDLAGYIRARLATKGDRQCRNFHAAGLAAAIPGPAAAEEARALEALRRLPFVGLVEDFEASMRRLESVLAPHFPGFRGWSARKNVTRDRAGDMEQRVAKIRSEIGEPLYEELVAANAIDLKIHAAVKQAILQEPAAAHDKHEIQNA
ncbi:MAG: hypothetical protein A3G81_16875 [Betaproteobacteria bacterium RIFCSPLOWO2_12_FULL_65_14]|nr:MAG: hypothetical protein A3G81_16875 [Betaproteobacteria bacterium RIFCSPLOWO2_12_FULL_65_14]